VTIQAIEFLDPDGSYALVQPFDEVRGRVLASNVLLKGNILHKDEELTWTEAAEDLGGFTRLGLSDLLPKDEAWQEPVWEDSELLTLLEEHLGPSREKLIADPRLQVESPPPEDAKPKVGAAEDPVGFLLSLIRHTRKLHERNVGETRWVAPCRCPAFQVKGDRLRTRLEELLTAALEKGRTPRLSRILLALREAFGRRADAA
jgi:hypothetical protein